MSSKYFFNASNRKYKLKELGVETLSAMIRKAVKEGSRGMTKYGLSFRSHPMKRRALLVRGVHL